jgi:hypothetical protein
MRATADAVLDRAMADSNRRKEIFEIGHG